MINSIKKRFSQRQFNLIQDLLENGKKTSWLEYAKKHNIKEDGNAIQRTKAANDTWRRFLRILNSENLELEVVKQVLNSKGDVLFETRKKPVDNTLKSTKGMVIDKITSNPYGGQWVTYKNQVDNKSIILPALEKLLGKLEEKEDKPLEEILSTINATPRKSLVVINLYDAHLDKLPVKSTCGEESTLEKNLDIFKSTILNIVNYIHTYSDLVDYILLPLGNDLFHTNGFNSQTKKGTQIEYLCQPEEAYYTICDVITWTIEVLSKLVPVKVLMIKGNHDEDKITTLGYWLNRYFKNTDDVDIDFTRRQRKYFKYGNNLLGFAHGDKEKSKIPQLPLIMATEAKEWWGETKFRKMYLGDLHHGFEYQFLKAKDMPGVEVEYLRSCGTTDTWHEDFGYIGIPKTAYVQFIDAKEGETTRLKFNIKPFKES